MPANIKLTRKTLDGLAQIHTSEQNIDQTIQTLINNWCDNHGITKQYPEGEYKRAVAEERLPDEETY